MLSIQSLTLVDGSPPPLPPPSSFASLDAPPPLPAPPTFPAEILVRILHLATETLKPLERQHTRFNFIQVCRLWYNSTAEIVRSECVVNGSRKAEKLARAFGTDDSELDGKQAKSLVLLDEGEVGGPNREARFAQLVARTRVLTSFEYFCKITFDEIAGGEVLDNSLVRSLVGLSELRRLKLHSRHYFELRDLAALQSVFDSCPVLECLQLSELWIGPETATAATYMSYALPQTTTKLTCSLELLRLLDPASVARLQQLDLATAHNHLQPELQDRDRDRLLHALLPLAGSVVSLKLPQMRERWRGIVAGPFLHPFLSSLTVVKHLSLPIPIIDPSSILTSLQKLPHLRTLDFYKNSAFPSYRLLPKDVVAFLENKPPSFRRLTLVQHIWDAWSQVDQDLVKCEADLGEVELVVGAGDEVEEAWI